MVKSISCKRQRKKKILEYGPDNSLKFSVHAARAASKANQILGLIKRSFVHLDIPLMKQLYISMVRPHLAVLLYLALVLVLKLYLSTFLEYWYWYLYLHAKYWYLYWYLNL